MSGVLCVVLRCWRFWGRRAERELRCASSPGTSTRDAARSRRRWQLSHFGRLTSSRFKKSAERCRSRCGGTCRRSGSPTQSTRSLSRHHGHDRPTALRVDDRRSIPAGPLPHRGRRVLARADAVDHFALDLDFDI